jgi:hypothetical protein
MAAVLAAVPALAQAPAAAPQQPVPAQTVEVSGSITSGVQTFDSNTNSAKFTEYRDLRDSFYLPRVTFALNDRATGWYFNMSAVNPTRADQTLLFDGGRPGEWHLRAHWVETPHNFSNEAQTPFIQRGPGLFTVPTTVPITFKKLATVAGDAPGVLASDELIAQFQANTLRFTPLRTQNNTGHFGVGWSGNDVVALNVSWDRRTKSGLRSTYGPIGDRPPRTLNVQFTEPVDHRTNDLTFSAEHDGGPYQVRLEYQYSDFGTASTPSSGRTCTSRRSPGRPTTCGTAPCRSTAGARCRPTTASTTCRPPWAARCRMNSRLTATGVYGRMEQNEGLLPYSFHVDRWPTRRCRGRRPTAQMTVVQWLADYVVNPTRRLGLRAFVRHHGLDNNTPEAQWNYVTSDTSNLNGTVSFKNRRINLAYAADRTNAGIDATYRLPARSTLTLGLRAREHQPRLPRGRYAREPLHRGDPHPRGALGERQAALPLRRPPGRRVLQRGDPAELLVLAGAGDRLRQPAVHLQQPPRHAALRRRRSAAAAGRRHRERHAGRHVRGVGLRALPQRRLRRRRGTGAAAARPEHRRA